MAGILIVDDERPIRRLLETAFQRAGYEVATAANAAEAMAACQSARFDLVLSDVMMPTINGHELARWLARNFPDTPTVLMSGYDVRCEKCAYSPRCRLLAKPFTPATALALVGEVLSETHA